MTLKNVDYTITISVRCVYVEIMLSFSQIECHVKYINYG